jgi:hypothetical protein
MKDERGERREERGRRKEVREEINKSRHSASALLLWQNDVA